MKEISKLGFGLYHGEETDIVDSLLLEIMEFAISKGINVFDCAPSYRNLRSEKLLGELIRKYPDRDFFISTKGGFVPFDFSQGHDSENNFIQDLFDKQLVKPELFDQNYFQTFDVIYLDHILKNTLYNLSRNYVDVYYLHNPEYFLARVGRPVFLKVIREVFHWLKECIAYGQVKSFGISSWNGFFNDTPESTIQLNELIDLSMEAGIRDYFQFVQIPFNFSQSKALFLKNQFYSNQIYSLIRLAKELGISVISSAPLGQGKLLEYRFPQKIKRIFGGMTNPQISLSFVLSAPGISSTLYGTTSMAHFKEVSSIYFGQRYSDQYFLETLQN
jgi:aryl-alcohol dehydrogenase-like predicted oxidoreductase